MLAAIAFASVLQASTAYRTALQQADTMFDYHLQELARSVQGGVPFAPGARRRSPIDFQVQIWGPDGAQIFRSNGAALPPQAVLGFSDMARARRAPTASIRCRRPSSTIQIAQDLDARQARARALALRAVLPVALLAPLLMMAVWWLISRSLAPVERMRRQVAGRAADDLSPLPDTGLPEEVLPLVQRAQPAVRAGARGLRGAAAFRGRRRARTALAAHGAQAAGAGAAPRARTRPAREAAIARLNDGIERAIRLVSQLLVLAREEGERGDRRAVAAHRPAGPGARRRWPTCCRRRRRGASTSAWRPTDAVWVRGQREALHILLRNLLDNAVKYSPEGGQVDISLGAQDGAPCLTVEDSGPGIPEEERDRVFDRFYRARRRAMPPAAAWAWPS